MPRLLQPCPRCAKPLEWTAEETLGSETLQSFKCGHSFVRSVLEASDPNTLDFLSVDGTKAAREYQKTGVQFILDSDFACVIGDQMRLGKTPQSLLALKNAFRLGLKSKALVLVRAANIWQWVRECHTWVDNKPDCVWVCQGTQSWIPPGFSIYLMSMDTFGRHGACEQPDCKNGKKGHSYHEDECKKPGCNCRVWKGKALSDELLTRGFDVVVVDEAHSFKNSESQRSQSLTAFLKNIERSELEQDWTFTCPFKHKQEEIPNHYKTLGIEPTASSEEAKKAYRVKASETHPDHGGTDDTFRSVNQAYMVLANPESKNTYDNSRSWDKFSWVEKVIIKVNTLEGGQSTSKSSHCPICKAVVSQSAAVHLKVSRKCGIVMLSGTLIENNAAENFVPLNLIAPQRFPSKAHFQNRWLDYNGTRIKHWELENFRKEIAPFVIRRVKEDVYTDLPDLNRLFTVIEIEDEALKKAYNKVLDRIEASVGPSGGYSFFSSIGELQQLRQICGLAKVNWVSDYAEELLTESETGKLAIGIHHHSVRDRLTTNLTTYNPLVLSGEDSPTTKDQVMKCFNSDKSARILIVNMLAGGVGLDLHECDNVLVVERQWNREKEKQFEFRFYNPDKSIKDRPTNVEYVLADKTIDKFFHAMGIEKEANVNPLLYEKTWELESDPRSFQQLMEDTCGSRL
jgi:curved DNA-binding protein CbpA